MLIKLCAIDRCLYSQFNNIFTNTSVLPYTKTKKDNRQNALLFYLALYLHQFPLNWVLFEFIFTHPNDIGSA